MEIYVYVPSEKFCTQMVNDVWSQFYEYVSILVVLDTSNPLIFEGKL